MGTDVNYSMPERILTQSELKQYNQDGYIIIPEVYDAVKIGAALYDSERIFRGEPIDDNEYGRMIFPTGSNVVDKLVENEKFLDIIDDLFGNDRALFSKALLFVRTGIGDDKEGIQWWQDWHTDHFGRSYLPMCDKPELFDFINGYIYFHDVDESCAPMQVIPGSHKWSAQACLEHGNDHEEIGDIRNVGTQSRVSLTATAGSVLFYSSYLLHAAIPFADKTLNRVLWAFGFIRQSTSSWMAKNTWINYEESLRYKEFFRNTSPRVRELFGFPIHRSRILY